MPPTTDDPGGAGELAVAAVDGRRRPAPTPAPPATMPTSFPINHGAPLGVRRRCRPCRRSRSRRPTASARSTEMPHAHVHPQRQAGQRRLPRRRAPALGAARPARRHRPEVRLRHRASARPARATSTARRSTRARCRSRDIQPTDEVTTIEGLPATVGQDAAPDAGGLARRTTSPSAATASRARSWPRSAMVKRGPGAGPRDHRRRPRRDPQRLPLRHLPAHPRGDQGRPRHRCSAAWRAALAVDHLLYGLILSELRRRPRS